MMVLAEAPLKNMRRWSSARPGYSLEEIGGK